MCMLWIRGTADSTIVVVKLWAYESTVTYSRVKLTIRDKDVKGKGSNMITKCVHMR